MWQRKNPSRSTAVLGDTTTKGDPAGAGIRPYRFPGLALRAAISVIMRSRAGNKSASADLAVRGGHRVIPAPASGIPVDTSHATIVALGSPTMACRVVASSLAR